MIDVSLCNSGSEYFVRTWFVRLCSKVPLGNGMFFGVVGSQYLPSEYTSLRLIFHELHILSLSKNSQKWLHVCRCNSSSKYIVTTSV